MPRITFDKEKIALNVARLSRGGMHFEVVIDPDLALEYREHKSIELGDVLRSEKVFSDAKKGMVASESEMKKALGTSDSLEAAKIIVTEGIVHLTAEHKAKLLEEKKRRIISIIHMNGVDPKAHTPHPLARIENAFAEAKVRIDEFKSAEDQIPNVLKALRPILPIRFEVKSVEILVPAKYAGKLHALARGFGRILSKDWKSDGSVVAVVEVPGGIELDFYSWVKKNTHGSAEAKTITEQR